MDRIKELSKRRNCLETAGTEARKFINMILDDMSFVEMDTFLYSVSKEGEAEGEGVISGFGRINDKQVCIFSQNIEVLKGGVGKLHAEKIVKCMLKASNAEVPLIGIIDTMGARIDEGTDTLEAYGEILGAAARLDVPFLVIIKSVSFGMISALCGFADVTFMVDSAIMTSASPLVIAASSGLSLKPAEIGGAKVHYENNKLADIIGSLEQIADKTKRVVTYIYNDAAANDELNRISINLNKPQDIFTVINEVFDKKSFIELGGGYAKNAVCGFALLDGVTVGIIAHNSAISHTQNSASLKKTVKYVNIFNGLDIPIINLVDTSGLDANLSEEQNGVISDVSDVVKAYSNYDGTMISVIIGKTSGIGYTVFASGGIGYDYTLAWASADISALPSESMAALISKEDLSKANLDKLKDKKSELMQQLVQKYSDENADVFFAARKGYIDNIIEPSLTRSYLIAALGMNER